MCNMDCIKWGARNLTAAEVRGKSVIEVGSYDVNGSLRYIVQLLEPAEYIGVDIVRGPGVDIVCHADDLIKEFGKERFDIVISTCALEHIRDWKNAVSNIKHICKGNGIILIIVPSYFPYHAFPHDYWRYMKTDIATIFSDCEILALEDDSFKPSLVYAKMKKPTSFTEKELSNYKLHSVVTNKRTTAIMDEDFKSFHFRRLMLAQNLINLIGAVGQFIRKMVLHVLPR